MTWHIAGATDGAQAFFTWTDRAGLWGARVLEDGTVVNLGGTRIHAQPFIGDHAIGYDGKQFIVAWLRLPINPGGPVTAMASRVARDGTILDPDGFVVAPTDGNATYATVTRDGDGSRVGWISYEHSEQFVYSRVTSTGSPGPVTRDVISNLERNIAQRLPVAISVDGAPKAFCEDNGFYGQTKPILVQGIGPCNEPGAPIRDNGISNARFPGAAYGAGILALGWLEDGSGIVHVKLGDSSAFSLGGSGEELALGFDGTLFHAVWLTKTAPRQLVEQRFAPTGTLIDSAPLSIAPAIGAFAIACPGGRCIVAFQDADGVAAKLLPIADASTVETRIELARNENEETGARVAAGPEDGYLVAWKDNRTDPSARSIYAVRVGVDGTILDSPALSVLATEAQNFAISATARHYVIASSKTWIAPEASAIRLVRIDAATGAVLDAPPIQLQSATIPEEPGISCEASQCLVAWRTTNETYAQRIGDNGIPIDPSPFVVGSSQGRVSVTHDNAGHYLLSWGEFAVRVDAATGSILDSPPLALGDGMGDVFGNASASNGSDFLVTWSRNPNKLLGARITATGNVLDPNGFVVASTWGFSALSTLTIDNYLSCWSEARDGECGIYGGTIGTNGSMVPPNGAPYITVPCDGAYEIFAPAGGGAASHRDGRALLVYDRFGTRTRRIRGQLLGP
ncbi:hypothetical protein LZC95_48060 [Pendulispora brunnea]|uniref:Uncharacterized protein n=1 Tax=Pendulispora brunnea TaxID=2905690 RepID=A0ABZ2K662_9BACT